MIAELLTPAAGSRIRFVSNAIESKSRRASPELVAVLSLGVTILLAVLGQAAWLDGKIERADARLGAQIEGLHAGQTAIRERLAALEARASVAGSTASGNDEPPDSAF